MVSAGRIVGFLGAYHSTRLIGGRSEPVCNLSSWFVAEAHRNESLMLLPPYLAMKNHTITGLTPAKHVHSIYQKFKFADLETAVSIIPIFSALPGSSHYCTVTHDLAAIPGRLNENERTLFDDHLGFDAVHLLAHGKSGHSHLVYTITRKKGFPMAYVHYMSDRAFFQTHLAIIAWKIFLRHGTPFICVESRHLRDPLPWPRKTYHLRVPRIFKSSTVAREDIDNLYSELIAANVFERYFY
jgi:hypothetical protein